MSRFATFMIGLGIGGTAGAFGAMFAYPQIGAQEISAWHVWGLIASLGALSLGLGDYIPQSKWYAKLTEHMWD